jgi:hypothetical protein
MDGEDAGAACLDGPAPVEEVDPVAGLDDDHEAFRLQARIRIGDGGR